MHNTCISSTISLSCKGSLSFSFSDYSYFLDDRFDRRNPILLSPSSCCACCASSSLYGLPINPSLLYGLRQSTLIQWSPCRRLILDGVNQIYSRLPARVFDRSTSYGKSYSFKEKNIVGRRGNWGNGRYGCNVDDAELILSLLSEEVGEECFGVRERNRGKSSRKVQLDKRVKNSGGTSNKSKKKAVGSGSLESTSKCLYESVKFQPREEERRQKVDSGEEKREIFSRRENGRARREGSSCSSYYSFSSSGEFESDSEIQGKHDGFAGESSSGYGRDHRDSRYDGEVSEEVDRHCGYAKEQNVVLRKENIGKGLYAASSGVEYDWRKKSEKKLNEELTEQTEARKESSEKHLRLSDECGNGYEKSFSSHKQYDDRKENSSLSQQHSQTGQRVSRQSESRLDYKQSTKMPEIHDTVVETTSSSQKQYRGREKNLLGSLSFVQETAGEQLKTDGLISREEKHRRYSQQLDKMTEIREIDKRETSISQRVSETRMKNQGDDATMIQRLVDDTVDQHHQAGQQVTGQMGTRGDQQIMGISNTQDINIQSTFISQKKSDNRMIIQEENVNSAVISYPEAPEQLFRMDSEAIRRLESRKESQGILNYNYAEKATSSNMVSGKGMSSKERCSSSVVKLAEETEQRYSLSDERVSSIGPKGEAQRPTKVMSFHEGMLEEAPSSQASLKLDSQSMVQQVGVNEKNTSLQATVRSQLHVKPSSGLGLDDFHSENLATGSSALHEGSPSFQHEISGEGRRSETHGEPVNFVSHEDALDSAARLQQSSSHFVGEFVEKVRHEVSTSEVKKERTTHETKFGHEGEAHEQKGLGQYSSGDSQQKDHDSRPLSQGSATKGPSHKMWDVTDPSTQEPLKTEVPDATSTAENSVVKRPGRSLWSVISDIVRLRRASHSETNNSRSGGRSSPNQSTSSDAWFSGHEPDENNDENVKQGRGRTLQEFSTVDQKQPGDIHAQSQGEVSSSKRSKDKIKHVKLSSPSSSNFESGSSSKDNLSPTFEETGAKHTSSGIVIAEPSFPLPAIRMRRSPAIQGISAVDKTDASGSGMMVTIEQPVSTSLTEVSETKGKDGEIKQRKLQRNKQVPKDRFDEWEEAYILETEQRKNDEMFMREALLEAKKAADIWEVPVGAVLVHDGKIIARGYNLVEELRDSTAHAEMICIREASNVLRSWRLSETTLYVTLEPCPMCAGAILQARIDTIVWGAPNKLLGADGSWIRLFPSGDDGQNGLEPTDKPAAPVHPFHPNVKIRRGILASECADIMQQFFQLRRRKKDKKPEPPTPPSCLPISSHPSKFLTKMHGAFFHIPFCM